MNVVQYAEQELKLTLTFFQKDTLALLQQDSDAWRSKIKPATHDMRLVLEVYKKWEEFNLVVC